MASESITFELQNGEQLSAVLKSFPEVMMAELDVSLRYSGEIVRKHAVENIDRNGSVDSSKLKNSIAVSDSIRTPVAIRRTVAPGVDYGAVVEKGRQAGKGISDEGMKQLERWVKRKGAFEGARFSRKTGRLLKSQDQAANIKAAAKAIMWKIYQKGIKEKPFLGPALDKSFDAFMIEINKAVIRAAEKIKN